MLDGDCTGSNICDRFRQLSAADPMEIAFRCTDPQPSPQENARHGNILRHHYSNFGQPDRHTCVICFRALSKHEGSELSSSSVERWVSTLSMTSLLNMSSLAVACATTVTNYLDFARNCPARPCPICCRLSKYCFHHVGHHGHAGRSPRRF